jgi:hypothetical protein
MNVEDDQRRQQDVNDEAVERGGRILRKAAVAPQHDAEHEATGQQRDVLHGTPRDLRGRDV